MQNTPQVERIQVVAWSAFAVLGIVVWNLWLHRDPLFFLNYLDPDRVAPDPFSALPWFVLAIVAGFAAVLLLLISAGERAAERRARSLYPNLYRKLDSEADTDSTGD